MCSPRMEDTQMTRPRPESTTTWIVSYLDGWKTKSIHPTPLSTEAARKLCRDQAARGVRCSMRRLVETRDSGGVSQKAH